MKKVLLLLTLCLAATGCNLKDIDRRMFVVAIGVDAGEKPGSFKISLKAAIPQGEASKADEKMQILTEESETISEALRRMKSRVDKELDYVHCKTIIIGEKLARTGIRQVVDWAVRRRDIQLILNYAVGRPNALKALELKPVSERIPSNALIMAMSRQGTESPFIVSVYSYQVMRDMHEQGEDPIMPIIEAESETDFRIEKAAVFDKDKMKLELSPEETRLYNMLHMKNIKTNLSAPYEGGKYEYYTENSSVSYKIHTPAGSKPYIRYKIKITGILEEVSTDEKITHAFLSELSKAGKKDLEEKINKLLVKVRDSGLDPFGWGLRYGSRHWNNADEMKIWEELYPRLEFKPEARVDIKYSGMIN